MEIMATEAIENATTEILNLFKTYVYKLVYTSHGANQIYHDGSGLPTYEFMESWNWSQIRKQVSSLVTEMSYKPVNMNYDPNTFLHGSRYSSPNDVRDNLPAILEGKQSRLWLSVKRPEKFWQVFIADMFDGGDLEKILDRHFSAVGFKRV